VTRYLLDTNVCVELLRGRSRRILSRLRRFPGDIGGVSSITVAELRYGAAKSADPAKHERSVNEFLVPLVIFPFEELAAQKYGEVRTELERRGRPIGSLDMLIAAHALSLDATLITGNLREFRRVAGLRVENWLGG